MKILEAKNITKMFPGVVALDSVDVAFEPGEIHAIIGEKGAGKSTLIKCLTGVYEPEEGEVPVSYTHLDVYKRQDHRESSPGYCLHGYPYAQDERAGSDRQIPGTGEEDQIYRDQWLQGI